MGTVDRLKLHCYRNSLNTGMSLIPPHADSHILPPRIHVHTRENAHTDTHTHTFRLCLLCSSEGHVISSRPSCQSGEQPVQYITLQSSFVQGMNRAL